ncbi:hypothetical protein D1609_16005 [Leptospira borgpetersenii serovar Hardjo-bovis]|nr:hypothetical protein B9T54_15875 [Leptospira borgpetersenii serovar Hardjo-bovis]AYR09696.1 hypothetical protein D1609_16005 [Leptospira borgpetersenii serovar Hardjo-bovis]TQE54565.1 hypothetical protein FFZ95_03685 [Leptospira borgpetersenii]TQE58426.1 hypothetical protein FFZ96_03910 [Leptospira borgpetersenii]
MNSRRSVIYGFSNEFYCWNVLVGVPTPEVLGQVLNSRYSRFRKVSLKYQRNWILFRFFFSEFLTFFQIPKLFLFQFASDLF